MDAATVESTTGIDIALAASNLAERELILAGAAPPEPDQQPPPLDPVAAWRVRTAAARLADQFARAAARRGQPATRTPADLARVLTDFHHLAAAPASAVRDELVARTHQAWLPGYLAALDHAEPAADEQSAAWWRAPEVYYGRGAIACAPFLRLLAADLAEPGGAAGGRGGPPTPTLTRDVQAHLLDRFELALAWALETQAKVHRAQRGIRLDQASPADYLCFLDETFQDRAAAHEFFLAFPMLGRWLAQVTTALSGQARLLRARLRTDAARVSAEIFHQPVEAFTGFRLGQGDSHAGGAAVTRVSARLAGGAEAELVYKPRCVRAEAGMQRLLGTLRAQGVLTVPGRPVLAMDGYGYEALIPAGRNTVATPAEAERVYGELGGYLALFYALGGGDLHLENVIVADGHAHVCDCETVFGVFRQGDRQNMGSMLDSVFKTGLLEWPRGRGGAAGMADVRLSGYSGGEDFEYTAPAPRVSADRMSYAMSVTHHTGVRISPGAGNRVHLNGELTYPQEFSASILAGFDRVYRWFQRGGRSAADTVAACFDGASTRFINWGTQLYSQLLSAVCHPRALMDPLECDLIFNMLRTLPEKRADDAALLDAELAALWRWDTPIFTSPIDAAHLISDHRPSPALVPLACSPRAYAAERIASLSEDNRRQQACYVAASLAVDTDDAALVSACLAHAEQIGERLCRLAHEPGRFTPWTSFQVTGEQIERMPIEGELYNGSAGVALFLAYLDAVRPRPEFRALAARAAEHALAAHDRTRIGAFTGVAGMVYLLNHLAALWDEPALLERAVAMTRDVDALIDADRRLDVFGGSAGAILVLLGLADRADGAGLEVAERCARHLLRHAHADGDTLSWPPFDRRDATANLTGLAHGAGGVGWALIALGRRLGRSEWVQAGRRAFAYEARHYDPVERDWPDLRVYGVAADRDGNHFANAWCNGAAGVGLTRLAAWQAVGRDDDAMLDDARLALAATMRGLPRLGNNSLCHGRSGNSELLLRFAQVCDEPAFRLEANVQAQRQWREVDDAALGMADESASFFPGLMLGISGFGLHYLRLADPERTPSPLLLDPPTQTRKAF